MISRRLVGVRQLDYPLSKLKLQFLSVIVIIYASARSGGGIKVEAVERVCAAQAFATPPGAVASSERVTLFHRTILLTHDITLEY